MPTLEIVKVGAAIVSASVGAITASVKGMRWLRAARIKRMLATTIGSDAYDLDTLQSSTEFYVVPNCSSIDLSDEEDVRQTVSTQENIFDLIDRYLFTTAADRHLLVLADSGMGKTSFVINYYLRHQRLRRSRSSRLFVIPLGLPDVDDRISRIDDKRNTILFLDALDEDTKAISDHRVRIDELMNLCREFRRVLITSRTQFFPSDDEIPRETGVLRTGPRRIGQSARYRFWKVYISPFSDTLVRRYLRVRYPLWAVFQKRAAMRLIRTVPFLSMRPMLLTHLPDLLTEGRNLSAQHKIYELLVERWVEREAPWVNPRDLYEFSKKLAVDVFIHRRSRGMERIPGHHLAILAKEWGIELEGWQIRGRSLLNRDAVGNYKFAHRSIMEYLIAQVLASGEQGTDPHGNYELLESYLVGMAHRAVEDGISASLTPYTWMAEGLTDQISTLLYELVVSDVGTVFPDGTVKDLQRFSENRLRLSYRPAFSDGFRLQKHAAAFEFLKLGKTADWLFSSVRMYPDNVIWYLFTRVPRTDATPPPNSVTEISASEKSALFSRLQLPSKSELDRLISAYTRRGDRPPLLDFHMPLNSSLYQTVATEKQGPLDAQILATTPRSALLARTYG
jgi:hypothetical protein